MYLLKLIKTKNANPHNIIEYIIPSFTDIFPEAIGLFLVRSTFLSKSLSTISLKIQPALLIRTEPKKNNNISPEIIILYTSAIFWTLGYDTIYGVQDMFDDEIIGVKSTSLKFKKNIKLFVGLSYLLTSLILVYLFFNILGFNLATLLLLVFILSLIYQLKQFDRSKPESCLSAFKFNNISGVILFLTILAINEV